jgi:hypothetical protein
MTCDERLEIRLSTDAKEAISRHALDAELTLSDFVRRAIGYAVDGRIPLGIEDRNEVVSLRSRVNSIEARIDRMLSLAGLPTTLVRALDETRRDLRRAHQDAVELLRC